MHILFVHHVLFLSSNYLEISIKHSFTSSDYHLLYLASACFLSLPLDFFHFVRFFSLPLAFVCVRLHLFVSVCILVPPQKISENEQSTYTTGKFVFLLYFPK